MIHLNIYIKIILIIINDNKQINNYNNNNNNQNIYMQNNYNNQINNKYQYDQNNNKDNNQNNYNYEQSNPSEKNNKQNINNNQNDIKNKVNKVIFKEKRHKPELGSSFLCSIIKYSNIIDRNESNIIKSIVEKSYVTLIDFEKQSLSSIINNKIKEKLGGKWFVFVNKIDQPISFNISFISEDLLIMKIGGSVFKIAKLDY